MLAKMGGWVLTCGDEKIFGCYCDGGGSDRDDGYTGGGVCGGFG